MKKWLVSLLRWSLLSLTLCTQVNAITLKKSDVETYLANKYVVGDINPDVPVWPLFVRDAADENQKPVLFLHAHGLSHLVDAQRVDHTQLFGQIGFTGQGEHQFDEGGVQLWIL